MNHAITFRDTYRYAFSIQLLTIVLLLQAPFEVQKRLEEVRLLESRKSARLADQDTDFARLADMAGDRKRTASHTIDVPAPSYHYGYDIY